LKSFNESFTPTFVYYSSDIKIKVATVPVLLGLVQFGSGLGWVWFRISKKNWLWFGSGFCDYLSVWFCFVSTEPENYFS
jgi:hypothetical protein